MCDWIEQYSVESFSVDPLLEFIVNPCLYSVLYVCMSDNSESRWEKYEIHTIEELDKCQEN